MLKIKKVKDGYIIYRPNKEGWHTHFTTYHKAKTCLSFIERGVMPGNEYFQESCRRLLTKEEFRKLGNRKPPYKNNSKKH